MIARYHDLVVNKWGARFMGQYLPCAIGRGGIGCKKGEGDGITPTGIYNICGTRYRPDRVQFTSDVFRNHPIGVCDLWSDDPIDPAYNQGVYAFEYAFSHERLRRADGLYDLFAILDYNYPDATAGAGSAIFIHAWRKPRHPTEGCIAFDPGTLNWILSNWIATSKVVINP